MPSLLLWYRSTAIVFASMIVCFLSIAKISSHFKGWVEMFSSGSSDVPLNERFFATKAKIFSVQNPGVV